ncbi:hypothetical protein [Agrobacterium sp.]|uniref:hypothetical protein n=1 Tax=Agrobacterium sp. TaxID=361 RepID=UPI004037CE30
MWGPPGKKKKQTPPPPAGIKKIIIKFKINIIRKNFNLSLQISILSPERPFWNGNAEEIILPTETGEMGVLKNPPHYKLKKPFFY